MSIPTWLAIATNNRLDGSYIQGDCDVTGNVICRGTNSIWLDTNSSIKLNNSGTVTTLSIAELQTLDAITTGVSIQTQINGKATATDVTNLQTKTQNISSATSVLTTFEDSVILTAGNLTLSLGNLILTSGDLSIASTKSIICDGELKLGSTGKISGTGLTISNAQLAYLNGLTASVETRLATCVQKLIPITFNSTGNTSDFTSDIYLNGAGATQIRTIGSDANTIQFDDTYGFINFLNKIHMYSEFQLDYAGTTYYVGTSLADIISRITGITYDSALDKTTIDNALEITGNITANTQTVTQTNLGHISGLSANANTSITNLNTKTANMTASGTITTYTGTHTFTATTNISTGQRLSINGTGKILLNGNTSYLEMGTSLGILTTAGVYINATEMSYLDGVTSSIQTQIGNINTSLTDLNLKTSDITYVALPPVTTIANAVSLTGSLKVAQQAWLDSSVRLKTTYALPASGELGYLVNATTSTSVTFVSNTAKSVLNVTLGQGTYIINYTFGANFTGTTATSVTIGYSTTNNAYPTNMVQDFTHSTDLNYKGNQCWSCSRVKNFSTSTTIYLTANIIFSGTAPALLTASTCNIEGVRIA